MEHYLGSKVTSNANTSLKWIVECRNNIKVYRHEPVNDSDSNVEYRSIKLWDRATKHYQDLGNTTESLWLSYYLLKWVSKICKYCFIFPICVFSNSLHITHAIIFFFILFYSEEIPLNCTRTVRRIAVFNQFSFTFASSIWKMQCVLTLL